MGDDVERLMHHAILANAKVTDVAAAVAMVESLERKHGVTLLVLDADAVFNARHLESAIAHAERAFQTGRNVAKSLSGEIFLYLTGERQVQRALEAGGLKPGMTSVVVVAIGYKGGGAIWDLLDRLRWSKNPAGLRENPLALEKYGIRGLNGGSELALLERVALVDLVK